ncbi:hypothetical protein [Alloactinosynnema sp. L-07]|uniref:hypothetical protein n=1 Tax=Alloactinosynnema sp. L-07 TaxID=1653480 RepID=UPI00065EF824|nr:hypothetical protein [Alloactinosynnema sp. L-07]CRK57025.1 hypothetical protein [Alloactinosynnema sp. L-07]
MSLAHDAIDGYPAATFGLLTGDADTTTAEPAAAATQLQAGDLLGDIVCEQNAALAPRGVPALPIPDRVTVTWPSTLVTAAG